ncbi:MAG: endonuclease III [Ignavibacteria bacterium]|jgi:endonuclease-3|nr:endonuclease III [Ignavibacteria bacterium]
MIFLQLYFTINPIIMSPDTLNKIIEILSSKYAGVGTDLYNTNPFQLLIATILSAQCTDKRVNMVTPELFEKYPDAYAFAVADVADVEEMIRSTGFYKNKALHIVECSKQLVANHNGQVPSTMEELTALQGVGRKTANCIMGEYFEPVGVVVDTHIIRICNLWKLVSTKNAVKIEKELMEIVPQKQWVNFTHYVIHLGRDTCIARRPKCSECIVREYCPSAL